MSFGVFEISGGKDSEVTLNGLLITNGALQVLGNLKRLRLLHCTLVPGLSISPNGTPKYTGAPSLSVYSGDTVVEIKDSIVGGLRINEDARIYVSNSIIDATSEYLVAYAGLDGFAAGGPLHIENCTVIGKVHTSVMERACNCIFFARCDQEDTWPAPVVVNRRQVGSVLFSYLPIESQVPRRYQCKPQSAEQAGVVRPQFTSLRYGDPGYCQLSKNCVKEILQGAEDESEMGVFHDLFQPQREANLQVVIDEYLRAGFDAGIFYAS